MPIVKEFTDHNTIANTTIHTLFETFLDTTCTQIGFTLVLFHGKLIVAVVQSVCETHRDILEGTVALAAFDLLADLWSLGF